MTACRFCGCTETTPCAGGCAWAMPGVCTSCTGELLAGVEIELSLLQVMAVHGNLCLALRHPENQGKSTEIVQGVIDGLERILVQSGALSVEQIDEIHRTEAAERPRIIIPGR